ALPGEQDSPFFKFIAHFECDLPQLLDSAIDTARARINRRCGVYLDRGAFGGSWYQLRGKNIFILCHPTLLLMAFDNYVANFYHSSSFDAVSEGVAGVIGTIDSTADEDGVVRVTFSSLGERQEERQVLGWTMTDHQRRLHEYGCDVVT